MNITITEHTGQCRWCGCTYLDPCPPGCDWANRQQTLCTKCVAFDKKIRSKAGRRELVDTYNIGAEVAA